MKKILFIIYTYSMGGGAENILLNVINGLAEKSDYEISVLEYAEYGIRRMNFNDRLKILKPIVDMNNSSRMERIIKYFLVHFCPWILRKLYIKEKYDVEISFNFQIPSFLTSPRKDVYNIQWNHGDIYELKDEFFKRILQGRSYKKADKIVVISENTRNSVMELFPQYKEKIRTVYNGTDLKSINNSSNEPTDISLEKNSMVFLGRIEPQKGIMRLVEYTERIINEGIDIKLYLLGTGVQDNEVAEYIEKNNLGDNIKMLGYISNPYPIIKQSKAVCMLSKSEGFPTVFTEGMALGKPFISTPVGGTGELSDNGKCGVLVNDYEEFKQAVLDVVIDNENNEQMGRTCFERIKLFSLDEQIENIKKLIEQK